MSGENNQNQPLGEREVGRILQRAAALQEQERQRGPLSGEGVRGVFLTELKQIAGEVGIDPRYVEAAAAELRSGDEGRGRFLFWGAPVSTEFEQTVEGEVSVEEWDRLVAKIRRSTGNVGQTSTLGQSLEWTGQTDHVSVSPREGRTTIRILSHCDEYTAAAHVAAFVASLFALMPIIGWLHGIPMEAAGLTAATAGGLFGLARVWAGAMFKRHRDRMQALLQELTEHVAHTAAERSASRSSLSPPPPLTEELPQGVSDVHAPETFPPTCSQVFSGGEP
jgi:hypothetical protein